MNVIFTIPGRLRGKGRPRFSKRGDKVHTFTDAKTLATEGVIRHFASEAMKGRAPIGGPVSLTVAIWQSIPASWSKKRKEAAFFLTGKPDIDNVVKAICDACNKIVFLDDAQISDLHVIRRYASESPERVEIHIKEWGNKHDGAARIPLRHMA